MNYKELRAHLGHVPVFLNMEDNIDLMCSCGKVIARVPRYRGAEVLGVGKEDDLMNLYVSFGDYDEDMEGDSFGVRDGFVYMYLSYQEFIDAVESKDRMLDEYYHIINYELVENDRG
jgi:hypothetical protein